MPDQPDNTTPFDTARELTRDAVLTSIAEAERELAERGQLSPGRWGALRRDFDIYLQLVRDSERWLQGRGG